MLHGSTVAEALYGPPDRQRKISLLFTGRHFWNRKCRKKTRWQQEFAVFKCEATENSVTGHVCVNSNKISEIRKKKALLLLGEIG